MGNLATRHGGGMPNTLVAGVLYVVATPIGNLLDLSTRARDILAAVDVIAAEDTRRTGILLGYLGIRVPMISMHDYNEAERVDELLERLNGGQIVALVSDAGTPLISDPGYKLVSAAISAGIVVSPIPGPSSMIAALSASGLPTDRFVFEGFLSAKAGARHRQLQGLVTEARTLVFFESPRRLLATLADMAEVWGGDRRVTIARELTKIHETFYHGTLDQLITRLTGDADAKLGEIVLCVEGAKPVGDDFAEMDVTRVLALLLTDLPVRKAVDLAAKLLNQPRNRIYELALKVKNEQDNRQGSAPED
jgi:16S rRNA (cytidine1402-2'-O)-methyltransferase